MKVLKWLDENLEETLLVIFLGIMVLIMGIQVCARYVFSYSLSWSEEITRYLFVWSGFLSVSYCTKKCIAIRVEQFVVMFPKRGKLIFHLVNHTIEFLFFLYLIPFAWLYLRSAITSGQVSAACGIPMYVIQVAPLFSFSLVCIRLIQRWIHDFKELMHREKEEK